MGPEEREGMADLANLVMKITEQLVKLLQQAADDQGQWHLPLNDVEVGKMRTFLQTKLMAVDGEAELEEGEEPCDMESLLATSYAWMTRRIRRLNRWWPFCRRSCSCTPLSISSIFP